MVWVGALRTSAGDQNAGADLSIAGQSAGLSAEIARGNMVSRLSSSTTPPTANQRNKVMPFAFGSKAKIAIGKVEPIIMMTTANASLWSP